MSVCLCVCGYLSGCVVWSRQVGSEWSARDRRAASAQPRSDTSSSCPSQHLAGRDPSPARRPTHTRVPAAACDQTLITTSSADAEIARRASRRWSPPTCKTPHFTYRTLRSGSPVVYIYYYCRLLRHRSILSCVDFHFLVH